MQLSSNYYASRDSLSLFLLSFITHYLMCSPSCTNCSSTKIKMTPDRKYSAMSR